MIGILVRFSTAILLPGQRVFDYRFDPRIHNLGNVGLPGMLHAKLAPFATRTIDVRAYGGRNVRHEIHERLSPDEQIVDFGCGVGISTFQNNSIGIDSSLQMVAEGRRLRPHTTFLPGDAETFGNDASSDVVTMMFLTHEMPQDARLATLNNAMRVARKCVMVVDISPEYKPNEMMLTGEPYILEYLEHIDDDVRTSAVSHGRKSWFVDVEDVVQNHVTMWTLSRNKQLARMASTGIGR